MRPHVDTLIIEPIYKDHFLIFSAQSVVHQVAIEVSVLVLLRLDESLVSVTLLVESIVNISYDGGVDYYD